MVFGTLVGLHGAFARQWHLDLAVAGLVVGTIAGAAIWGSRGVMSRAGGDVEVWLPAFFAVSFVGLWATVPDTELPVMVVAASLPLALPGVIGGLAFGKGARIAVVSMLLLVTWVGSAGYTTSWLGASCCVAVALVCASTPRRTTVGAVRLVAVGGVHLIANVLGSRVVAQRIGVRSSAAVWISAAAVVATSCVIAWTIVRRAGDR